MRVDGRPFSVDANIILRYLVRDDEQQYAKAAAAFEAMEARRVTLLCDPVILAEVVWVSASFYNVPREKIAEYLESLIEADGFVIPNKGRYVRALQLYASSVPHFGDACACAAAVEDCDGNLLSFDRKLSTVKGISRRESV